MDTNNNSTNQIFNKYLQDVSSKYSDPQTSEYGYRTPFEIFLRDIFSEINVKKIDHDSKAIGGNKPDFVLSKDNVPLLYIEVKDIGVSLDKIENSEQLARYYGYDNLVLTDYLEFRFYRNGIKYTEPISIASYDKKERTLSFKSDSFELLRKTLIQFTQTHKEAIKSGSHLAKIMGGKAYRIRENAKEMLKGESKAETSIYKVFQTMKKQLIHDMDEESFADMYAQTLVYGLFVARFHDNSPDTFTRSEARDLVPASNPLLRHFFDHIAGADFDDRLNSIVDELCRVFSHSDISKLISNYYGTEKSTKDPVIHFYEDFLQEYDKEKRKTFGAYYTPLPVVQFIVKAVDHILEHDFKLTGGLANSSKNENGHIVQVLDPATGTGTFLTEVIKLIHDKKKNQSGIWGKYVLDEVLPRLFGFEIMIAPYTIAHLKMSMLLKETGFKYFNNRRLGIYLTNSLEEGNTIEQMFDNFGLAQSISEESKQASKIKKEKPIMVVIGNPPYSVSSQNKGVWIQDLIKVYKKDLNEKKINLDDDYIKFIRFAESFIEKNGSGVLAMITNNSFLDGITHRQMRKHLLETFDNVYVLNLHGNAKRKETSPDGSKDENVFDIQQGVSINIFVKNTASKKNLGNIFYADLYGAREHKFKSLDTNKFEIIKWQKLTAIEPYYFFVYKNFDNQEDYSKGFKLVELFNRFGSGISTGKDNQFYSFTTETFKQNFENFNQSLVSKSLYRPFDIRELYYDRKQILRPSYDIMKNMNLGDNLSLLVTKRVSTSQFRHSFISRTYCDRDPLSLATQERTYVFPLYLYSDDDSKEVNFNSDVVKKIEANIGKVTAEQLLAYIYSTLNSNNYRIKYNEFLKIDFPTVPYPKDRKTFDKLAKLGNELIQYHLLENSHIDTGIITYTGEGENIVENPKFENGKVYINKSQYFGNVTEIAWNFYIGGYQPAQKWLKDRKGKELSSDDVDHYSKIIIVLNETNRLMNEIDKISFE